MKLNFKNIHNLKNGVLFFIFWSELSALLKFNLMLFKFYQKFYFFEENTYMFMDVEYVYVDGSEKILFLR